MNAYWQCLRGIVLREWLRFVLQRTRFLSALVRPLLWLAGVRPPGSAPRWVSR